MQGKSDPIESKVRPQSMSNFHLKICTILNRSVCIHTGSTPVQVIRTCKEMGIKSVAIYSDADAQAVSICVMHA